MKHVLIACLLAVSGPLFAQNLTVEDLRFVLYHDNTDSLNTFLQNKGYINPVKENLLLLHISGPQVRTGYRWSFRSGYGPDDKDISVLHKQTDSSGHRHIHYETSNTFFYTQLLNAFVGENFELTHTGPAAKQTSFFLSNHKEEISIPLTQEKKVFDFQFTFTPVSTVNGPR